MEFVEVELISPYLFIRYIQGMINADVESGIGCAIGNVPINILVYADDLILIAPSWN